VWKQVLELSDLGPARRFALEFEMIVNPVYPMPHLIPMLEACRERQLSLGLVSNAQFYTPMLFECFLGADLTSLGFRSDLIFLSYRFGCAKPSLKLFEFARTRLDRMGIAPRSVLYVGNDMLNDIYPATQAGFATALFAGDARSLRLRSEDPRCRTLSPDLIVTDLLQLCNHL
jgi:putative hydrolase of the HAD superfamily